MYSSIPSVASETALNTRGEQPTKFIITVDTETYAINNVPPEFGANIYGNLPDGAFGVQRIMDICNRHQVKATFFVDVYMHYHYGKAPVRDLCRTIDRAGHDVQLHAHTSWLPGSVSGKLRDFSREKQIEIVAEGKNLICEWIGKPPVAFRAGAYTANLDTIYALERNNFVVDSSYFAFHANCALSHQLGNKVVNKPFHIDNIFEIPVTCYWLTRRMGYQKLSKLDINACSTAEMNDVIPKLVHGGAEYIILFLHSFSFVRWKRDFSGVIPNYRAVERFEALLASIRNGGYPARFSTMADVAGDTIRRPLPQNDFIPTVRPSKIFPRVLLRMVESNP